MFNYNPWSTLEAVQRWLPLGDCAARQGTNYVGCPRAALASNVIFELTRFRRIQGAEIVCAVPKVCPQLFLQS